MNNNDGADFVKRIFSVEINNTPENYFGKIIDNNILIQGDILSLSLFTAGGIHPEFFVNADIRCESNFEYERQGNMFNFKLTDNIGYIQFDWNYNSYRNSDINSFKLAAEYLAQKEIMVFRMGANVEKIFSSQKNDFIIDYANCSWKNEMLDIYLSIKSLFFISTGTGLDAVSVATRRPLLWVNQAQPLHVYKSKKNFMFITKYFYSTLSDKFLSPREFYEIGIELGFTVDNPLHLRTQDLRKLGIKVLDNSDIEIRDATIAMQEMLTSNFEHGIQSSELQRRFWKAFPDDKRLDNSEEQLGRVNEQFLNENSWLIN
jgi:putative glycosyltransferase (TIGR04372 family)